VRALVKAIGEDVGVRITFDTVGGDAQVMETISAEMTSALLNFHRGVYLFAIGVRHKLHIALDWSEFQHATRLVTARLTNKQLREDLALLEGVLSVPAI